MSASQQTYIGMTVTGSYSTSSSFSTTNTLLLGNMINALSGSTTPQPGPNNVWTFSTPPKGTNLTTPLTIDGIIVHFEQDTTGEFMVVGRTENNNNITEFIFAVNRKDAKESFLSLYKHIKFRSIFIVKSEDI